MIYFFKLFLLAHPIDFNEVQISIEIIQEIWKRLTLWGLQYLIGILLPINDFIEYGNNSINFKIIDSNQDIQI